MAKTIRNRLTYSNVVATIALFVALGGVGYAAVHLKKDSVKSKQIKDGQVKTQDIANGAVAAQNIANGAVATQNIANGAVATQNIANGAVTPTELADGAISGQKLGSVVVRQASVEVPDGTTASKVATCDQREKAIGGGTRIGGSGSDLSVLASYPVHADGTSISAAPPPGPFEGWEGFFGNAAGGASTSSRSGFVYVICIQ